MSLRELARQEIDTRAITPNGPSRCLLCRRASNLLFDRMQPRAALHLFQLLLPLGDGQLLRIVAITVNAECLLQELAGRNIGMCRPLER